MVFDHRWMRGILCSIGALVLMLSFGIDASASRFGGNPLGGNPLGGNGKHQSKNQQDQKPDTVPSLPPDDPLVNSSTPPPPEAKMITKVGWCEVQVFGHTFSDIGLVNASLPMAHMHLSERLTQLSSKLKFMPGKTGIQLMDNVDALVKYVYANKKSATSSESSPPTPVTPAK